MAKWEQNDGWYDFYEILEREQKMGLIARNTPEKPEEIKPKRYKVSFFGLCEIPGVNKQQARKHAMQFLGKGIKVQAMELEELADGASIRFDDD
jgi:hypothetical protein